MCHRHFKHFAGYFVTKIHWTNSNQSGFRAIIAGDKISRTNFLWMLHLLNELSQWFRKVQALISKFRPEIQLATKCCAFGVWPQVVYFLWAKQYMNRNLPLGFSPIIIEASKMIPPVSSPQNNKAIRGIITGHVEGITQTDLAIYITSVHSCGESQNWAK